MRARRPAAGTSSVATLHGWREGGGGTQESKGGAGGSGTTCGVGWGALRARRARRAPRCERSELRHTQPPLGHYISTAQGQ